MNWEDLWVSMQYPYLLEDAAATRQTSGQMDVFVSMFVCSSDARS